MESFLPVFIDIPEKDQAQEIRQYLISAGADLSSTSKENLYDDLACLLDACDNWLKSASDADLEAMMNSFISLILICTFDSDKLTRKFCSKLRDIGASENNALLRVKILNNLFTGIPETNILQYDVYISQVKLASRFGLTGAVCTQLKQVKEWLDQWNVSLSQRRTCYRELHGALKDQSRSEEATKVMLELLSTYDEASASQARDDAEKCIIDYIGRPDVYIMNHLLDLKPVRALQGQPIHQLLNIFVSGKLSDYLEFYSKNADYIDGTGLLHEQCVQKMRILTFLSMTSEQTEMSFGDVTSLLDLNEDDLEDFVVGLIQTNLVHAKIDQINRKIVIRSSSRRTFGRHEWEYLREKLEAWRNNVQSIRTGLEQVSLNHVGA